jgi:hypothetical protein
LIRQEAMFRREPIVLELGNWRNHGEWHVWEGTRG